MSKKHDKDRLQGTDYYEGCKAVKRLRGPAGQSVNRERKQETEDEDLEKAMITVPDDGKSSNRRRNNNANWL